MDIAKVRAAAELFAVDGQFIKAREYGDGHINDTYLVSFKNGDDIHDIVLQRVNKDIFINSEMLMENMTGVVAFMRKSVMENGGDPAREALRIVPLKNGKNHFVDEEGYCWRATDLVKDVYSYSVAVNGEQLYETGRAFGRFIKLLANYDASSLHETIANFHNTKSRFEFFKKSVAEDKMGRLASVLPEVEFALKYEDFANTLVDMLEKGELPLRVTHNDTKINNVLIDRESGKAICVLDLDTVMPGLMAYDFGDAIRSGTNPSDEDERDLSKVTIDMNYYESFAKGYLEEAGDIITEKERLSLPIGAKMMTYECGIRFLGDHLNGDTYFKIHRENQNLDRARTQFKMVADMEKVWDEMLDIVRRY